MFGLMSYNLFFKQFKLRLNKFILCNKVVSSNIPQASIYQREKVCLFGRDESEAFLQDMYWRRLSIK